MMMINKYSKSLVFLVVATLLLCMAYLMFSSSREDSATTDESTHIISGYLANTDKDFNINTEHPYLGKRINTLPLLFMNINLDRSEPYFSVKSDYYYDSWRESRNLGNDFLYKMGNDADKILKAVRSVPIVLTIIFGLILFISVLKIYNFAVAFLTLIFYVFSPDILAHARLANTDMWITVFYFLSIISFGSYLQNPTNKKLVISALIFGLTLSVKFSSVTLIPVLLFLWYINNKLKNKLSFTSHIKASYIPALIFVVISWCIAFAKYGFSIATPPLYQQNLEENYYNKVLVRLQPIAQHFVSSQYFKGLAILSSSSFGNRNAYLLGNYSQGGWWYYFPVALSVKTPIPILIIIIASIVFYIKWRKKLEFNDYLILSPILIYFLISMVQKLNIGIRHLLPIMPFLFIWISKFMIESFEYFKKQKSKKILDAGYLLLIIWYVIGSIRIYPYFLSYFNEFVGPQNGSKVLADSNIDWGQDLKRLKTWLVNNKISEPIFLEYFWDGYESIDYYQINYKKLEPNNPNQKGYIAIGVSALNNKEFLWLKSLKPIAQIGYSINIYNIE